MSKKWRVSLGEKVLGHYAGHSPEEAVEKAKSAHSDVIDFTDSLGKFSARKAGSIHNDVFTL